MTTVSGKGANIQSLDRLSCDIATRLVKAKSRAIDKEIQRSLAAIGEFYGVDSVDFRRFSDDRARSVLVSWWVSSSPIGVASDLDNERIPWAAYQILQGKTVRIDRLEDLPSEAAAGRSLLRELGLRAAMMVPVRADDRIYGVLMLATRNDRAWTDGIEAEVRGLGDVLAMAYSRAQRFDELWSSEERLRAVIENQTEFIIRGLPDGTRTWVNDSYCKFFGQSREEIIGTNFMHLIPPEERPKVRAHLEAFTPDAPVQTLEVQTRRPSGELAWLHWIGKGIFDDSGALLEIQSVGRDITDQRRAETALKKSEERYRRLFESANDAILVLEGDRFVDCNSKAMEIFERRREEIIGKSPWEISDRLQAGGSSPVELSKDLIARGHAGNAVRFDWVHEKMDGSTAYMDISLAQIELAPGKPALLAIVRDVTEARRIQEDLERRVRFQARLTGMSSRILRGPIEETAQRINAELEQIGRSYGLGRISTGWYPNPASKIVERYAGWDLKHRESPLPSQDEHVERVPWFSKQVLEGEKVIVDDVRELPPSAAIDRETLLGWGIRSLAVYPVQLENEMVGWCVFSRYEQRDWDDITKVELGLIADAVIGACAVVRATRELVTSEQDLARSQKVARVGSYMVSFDTVPVEDPRSGTLKVSAEFRHLFGLDEGPVTIEQAMSRIHADDVERMGESLANAVQQDIRKVETFRVIRPDGSTGYIENRFLIVHGGPARTIRIFGTCQDVTEQFESRQEIERALVEIQELKDRLQDENLQLREDIRVAHGFDKIVGTSPKLRKALRAAEKVAPTDVPVLILGETGTGKELLAQSVHDLSRRKDRAMISVNCAALSRDLIESELFGHEKGAFTGAVSQRRGRFERADGGALFMDEIGELSGELQAKLLRVLQTGEFERLGGSTTLKVDVRLIAATNKNLQKAVDNGEFRADLYYRIASFPIELPPLRERREDIPLLAEVLSKKHARQMGKDVQSISARTLRYLSAMDWPGNVRELEGFIQRALISTDGPVLDYAESHVRRDDSVSRAPLEFSDRPTDMRSAEREHIRNVLERCRWVISGKDGAAAKLNLAPSTLRSRMKRLNIERPE